MVVGNVFYGLVLFILRPEANFVAMNSEFLKLNELTKINGDFMKTLTMLIFSGMFLVGSYALAKTKLNLNKISYAMKNGETYRKVETQDDANLPEAPLLRSANLKYKIEKVKMTIAADGKLDQTRVLVCEGVTSFNVYGDGLIYIKQPEFACPSTFGGEAVTIQATAFMAELEHEHFGIIKKRKYAVFGGAIQGDNLPVGFSPYMSGSEAIIDPSAKDLILGDSSDSEMQCYNAGCKTKWDEVVKITAEFND